MNPCSRRLYTNNRAIPFLALTALLSCLSLPLQARTSNADCWLWPGADPRPCKDAGRVYLMQGHFHRDGHFEQQGPSPGRAPRPGRELVLVYRMDRLPAHGALQAVAAPAAHAWHQRGWRVQGLQIDFDSPTAKLVRYADWVVRENEGLRDADAGVRILSVTGLGDWLLNGSGAALRALNQAAGTVAFMFYHRGRSIAPLEAYIDALRRSSLRFKVGLLPTQASDARFAALRDQPGYGGDIIFQGRHDPVPPAGKLPATRRAYAKRS